MSERYCVRVTKDYLVFSAAHFISYDRETCERLHGHNYRVAVEVEGPLDEHHLVFDFIALRDATREITDRLDHRIILATEHPFIRVSNDEKEVTVTTPEARYVFPRVDCVLLSIENTTAERLAWWIAGQLRVRIEQSGRPMPTRMKVDVEENFGQWADYEWSA